MNAISHKAARASSDATQDRVESAAHDQARPGWLQPAPVSCERASPWPISALRLRTSRQSPSTLDWSSTAKARASQHRLDAADCPPSSRETPQRNHSFPKGTTKVTATARWVSSASEVLTSLLSWRGHAGKTLAFKFLTSIRGCPVVLSG